MCTGRGGREPVRPERVCAQLNKFEEGENRCRGIRCTGDLPSPEFELRHGKCDLLLTLDLLERHPLRLVLVLPGV
jgi:hypothetical protein